jgi:hypothetical protein
MLFASLRRTLIIRPAVERVAAWCRLRERSGPKGGDLLFVAALERYDVDV